MKSLNRFDSATNIAGHRSQPAKFCSGKTLSAMALSASLIAALGLGLVACSKQNPKPTTTNASLTTPAAPVNPTPTVVSEPAPAPVQPPARKKLAKKRPAKVTYKNSTYGVSFQYPRRYALKTGDEAIIDWFGSQPVGMNFVQSGGVAVAAVELPRGSFPGTDYRDAFFTLNVNRSLSEAQCSQFAVLDDHDADEESIAPSTITVGGHTFASTAGFEGKATEQAYARYYHMYENGACYEMALGVETAGYGVTDGISPVDRDAVFHQLETILASVKIESSEPQPVVASAPTASEGNGAH